MHVQLLRNWIGSQRHCEDAGHIGRTDDEAAGAAVAAGTLRRGRRPEDQPRVTGDRQVPIPPFTPCKLDFREGCYQINFKPTASLVTFEGTLRVDRSAPDGGADQLIVSGDLYSRLPVIGPITPTPAAAPADVDEVGEPIAAMSTSVAGALSAVDDRNRSASDSEAANPDLSARALSLLSQGDERLGAGAGPETLRNACSRSSPSSSTTRSRRPGSSRARFPNSPSRTVTLKLFKVPAPFPFSLTGGPFYEGRLFEGGVDKGSVTLALGVEVLPPRNARNRHAGGSGASRAGAGWSRRHGVLRHRLRQDRLAADGSPGPAQRSGARAASCLPTAGAQRICTR